MSLLIDSLSKNISLKMSNFYRLPQDTIEAGTYLYPFYGMYYFAMYPELWAFYLTVLIPQLIVTLIIYIVMFILFLPLMTLWYTIFMGPLAIFGSWVAILNLSTTTAIFLVSYLLMPDVQRVAFDAVMSREFADDVVLLGKLRRIAKVPFIVKCGRIFWIIPYVWVLPYLIAKLALIISLHFIPFPFVGSILSILLQAPTKGLQAHSRYFTLKGFDKRQIHAIYVANRGSYLGFGMIAVLLEQIPFIGLAFMFTDTLGAALWAVTIEQREKREAANLANEMGTSSNSAHQFDIVDVNTGQSYEHDKQD